jgi:hypothetical protein
MRRVRSSWAVFVIALSTLLGAPHRLAAQQSDTVRTATLAGVVRDSTGAPVADVIVSVGRTRLGARTSAGGWFTIESVAPGDYTVRFERLGYGGATFAWHARAGERTEIAIELSPVARDLDTVVVQGKASSSSHPRGHAEVLGIVVDSAGVPLPDVQGQVIGSGRFAAPGGDGQFLFPELAPGSYLLRIRRLGFVPQTIPIAVGEDGSHSLAIRMSALGLLLDTVEVRAKSGFGKDASAWRDFDTRLRFNQASTRSVTLLGPDLAKLGKLPLDVALRYTHAVSLGVVPGMATPSITTIITKLPWMINADPNSAGAGDDSPNLGGGRRTSRVSTGTGPSSDIQDTTSVCILLNGTQPLHEPLRMFNASDLQAVEVYAPVTPTADVAPESDLTRSVEARLGSIPACAPGIEGGHPAYFVVWLKDAP